MSLKGEINMTDTIQPPTVDTRSTPPPPFPTPPAKSRFFKKKYIWWGLAIVLLLVIIGTCTSDSDRMTVNQARRELMAEINSDLENPDSQIIKYVEGAHLTVKVKSTSIVRCDIETIDGSDRVGRNGENIKFITLLIRFNWEGVFDKGYTDVKLAYDAVNDRVLEAGIDYTTAMINLEDTDFWIGLGVLVGSLL